MSSSINEAWPRAGNALTANVRANFLAAKNEIEAIQLQIQSLIIGTDIQAYSAILDAITASFLIADETKLDGIETAATADQSNAQIKTAYEANSNTNAFTDGDESKLDGIEASADANPTNAETKTAYEANANTNEFSDAEQSKLAGVEIAADVTDAANVAAAGGVLDTGNETIAGIKTFSSDPLIPDEVYGAGWNGKLEPPTKNAVYDKIETIASSSGVPAGAVTAYAGSVSPAGWFLCYGQAINRTTYSDLFDAIGTAYGVGNGSTTFNLPDLRGRVPLGKDNMGGSSANRVTATQADNLGQASGAQNHTLVISEMPAHTHTKGFNPIGSVQGGGGPSYGSNINTGSTGGGGSHNNMQPYQTTNYIIKT